MDRRDIPPDEDPVCAMRVEVDAARSVGLHLVREDHLYVFCSIGCLLEFREDPAWFLDPAYTPARR